MEALKILERAENLNWFYDEDVDVLYISIGEPKAAESVDAGEGVIVRIDPKTQHVVGVTVVGLMQRAVRGLTVQPTQPAGGRSLTE